MTSIFANPNVFAGCMGIGVFLSLGLAGTSQQKGHRRFHLVCLYINALSFFLAFSMGASGVIVVAFLVYPLLERKSTSGAALLCVADQFVGQRLGKVLEGRARVVPILIGAAVALLVIFAVVAMQLTGAANLNAGETLRRAAYPQPGSYTLSVTADGSVNVTLESQNKEDTMMHTSTVIYSGPADRAVVEVPAAPWNFPWAISFCPTLSPTGCRACGLTRMLFGVWCSLRTA